MIDQTEFEKFRDLVRQVVKVPKSKIVRAENKSKKKRKHKARK